MGEVQFRRPATPSQTLDPWFNDGPDGEHHPSPTRKVSTSSPPNSFGGNISSLSSRNSSLSHSQSMASLRSLFSRGRSASVASQRLDTSLSRGRQAGGSGKHSRHSSVTVARAESPHLSQIGSRLDSNRPTQVTHAAHVERARSKQQRFRRRPSPSWDPPPLFQAHSQSLKHAVLDASCLPTEVILRKSLFKDGRTLNELAKADRVDTQGVGALLKKAKENKHARKLSASISSSGWTRHLFILIESGYLLQYAGSGHHDRLPEKMMQLGKDTVAFASDAIPGRHWVLQIAQAAEKDSATAPESSKGLLSRIGMQSLESRRTTQNFLMVFDNADDLDSWLTAIRREVEALGGRQYAPETPPDVGTSYVTSPTSIQRDTIQNDSYQFSGGKFAANHGLSPVESEYLGQDVYQLDHQMREFRFWDHGTVSRKGSEDSSTITSTDLDRLRDSKDSGGSANTGISTGLHGTSPSLSPGCATRPFPFSESAYAPVGLGTQIGTLQVQESTLVEQHSPTFLCHALDANDVENVTLKAPHNTSSNGRKLSNVTPNFSVPIFSNRGSFFGTSEALNTGTTPCTTATNSPMPDNASFDGPSTEDDSLSRRPVSTIAPLPTPEALMNPTGNRTRSLRRPSIEKPLSLELAPVDQRLASSLVDYGYDSSCRTTATTTRGGSPSPSPSPSLSPEHATPILSALLPKSNELPALPRSKSAQGLSTFYNADDASAPTTLAATPLPDLQRMRPLSLSGFLEPPDNVHPDASSPMDMQALDPSIHVKPLAFSNTTSLPTVIVTRAPAGVNARLWRIRDARGLPKLGLIPPSGPPPSCPLPATPSPRKRQFRPLQKPSSPSTNIDPRDRRCPDQTLPR
jgi:hypothetical protein